MYLRGKVIFLWWVLSMFCLYSIQKHISTKLPPKTIQHVLADTYPKSSASTMDMAQDSTITKTLPQNHTYQNIRPCPTPISYLHLQLFIITHRIHPPSRYILRLKLVLTRHTVRKHDFQVLYQSYESCNYPYMPLFLQMAIIAFLKAFYYTDLRISLQLPTRYRYQLKGGGQSRVLWTGQDLQGFDPITIDNKGIKLDHNGRYKYICSCLSSDYENYVALSPNIIAADIPVINLLNQPRRQLLLLSAFHYNMEITAKSAISFIRSELRQHQCGSKCRPTLALFQYVPDAIQEHLRMRECRSKRSNKVKLEHLFPPLPLDKCKINQVVNNFCHDLDKSDWIEDGCAVCGLLYLMKDLRPLDQIDIKLSSLEVVGQSITRQERYSEDDPIKEMTGPIVAPTCKHICKGCLRSLKEFKIPPNALANGLWLGEVPSQLSDLTWTERLMISRVNHNYCVISVKESGMHKMRANAVAYMVPIPKVYAALPPSKDELDEVLAFYDF